MNDSRYERDPRERYEEKHPPAPPLTVLHALQYRLGLVLQAVIAVHVQQHRPLLRDEGDARLPAAGQVKSRRPSAARG